MKILILIKLLIFLFSSQICGQENKEKIFQKTQTVVPHFKTSGTIKEIIQSIRDLSVKIHGNGQEIQIIERLSQETINEIDYSDGNNPFEAFETEDDPFEENDLTIHERNPNQVYFVNYKNLTFEQIIKYFCVSTGMVYKVDEQAVLMVDRIFTSGHEPAMRFYVITPARLALIREFGKDEIAHNEKVAIQTYLKVLGIKPYNDEGLKYFPKVSRLIAQLESSQQKRLEVLFEELEEELHPKQLQKNEIITELPTIYKNLQAIIPKIRLNKIPFPKALDQILSLLPKETHLNIIPKYNAKLSKTLISFDVDDIPIGEVIKYLCEQVSLSYKIQDKAVIIGKDLEDHLIRIYDLPKSVLKAVGHKKDIAFKNYFEDLSVYFPNKATIKIVADYSKIILDTTNHHHKQMKMLLNELENYSWYVHEDNLNKVIPRIKFQGRLTEAFKMIKEATATKSVSVPLINIIYRSKVKEENHVNLDLENVTVLDTIKHICFTNNLTYHVDPNAIVISHPSAGRSEKNLKNNLKDLQEKVLHFQSELNTLKEKYESLTQTIIQNEKRKNLGIGKILQISIPKVRLKNRDIDFVVDFIRRTSRDLNEEGVGLNIVVGNIGKKTINLDLDNIPIRELLNYVCDQADLKLVVKNNAVLISNNQNSNP